MKKRHSFFLLLVSLAGLTFAAPKTPFETTGDILRIALPLGALSYTLYKHDYQGTLQCTQAVGCAALATGWTKLTIDKNRPDGEPYSFVSGHTSFTVSSALFLYKRYGPCIGIPATVLSVITGISRISSHKHFPEDVIAGALIGVVPSLYFTTKFNTKISIKPIVAKRSVGTQIQLAF